MFYIFYVSKYLVKFFVDLLFDLSQIDFVRQRYGQKHFDTRLFSGKKV